MTIPVPTEAAQRIRAHKTTADDFVCVDEKDLLELLAFVDRFGTFALPGLGIVAGETNEIRLVDETLEAQSFDLIRLNERVYVPETIEAVDVLHVAGNGKELSLGDVDEIVAELEQMRDEEDPELFPENRRVLDDGVRLIRFLVDPVIRERDEEIERLRLAIIADGFDGKPGELKVSDLDPAFAAIEPQ